MKLEAQAWVDILAGDYRLSKECVIFTTKFRNRMTVRKDIAKRFFADFEGIQVQAGDEITLTSGGDNGTRLVLPDWAVEQLDLKSGDTLCITKRSGLQAKKDDVNAMGDRHPGFYGDGYVYRQRCGTRVHQQSSR